MKKTKLLFGLGIMAVIGVVLVAADHLDAPDVAGKTADIADFYGFESPDNENNTVFIVDLQTNVMPNSAYGTFDENVLTEINIDNDGDLLEDLVIQALPRGDSMYFFGPATPMTRGLSGEILVDNPLGSVKISADESITTTTDTGVKLFAGPRQDAFFFDFNQFNKVIGGDAPEGFLAEGEAEDTFDGSNTMSIAIDIPNSLLGDPSGLNVVQVPVYKTWVTTNIKQ